MRRRFEQGRVLQLELLRDPATAGSEQKLQSDSEVSQERQLLSEAELVGLQRECLQAQ